MHVHLVASVDPLHDTKSTVNSREVLSPEQDTKSTTDCGAHWVCTIVLYYAGLIVLWELEKSCPGAKILSGLNIRLDSRLEPVASVAAPLEIRRSNLTSYRCLVLPMISWQKHTGVSYYYKVGNVLPGCFFLSKEEKAAKRYFYRIRSEWII